MSVSGTSELPGGEKRREFTDGPDAKRLLGLSKLYSNAENCPALWDWPSVITRRSPSSTLGLSPQARIGFRSGRLQLRRRNSSW
jgi:hypothetical protein